MVIHFNASPGHTALENLEDWEYPLQQSHRDNLKALTQRLK